MAVEPSSRLILTNLPTSISKLELSVHLSGLSVPTSDVQLISNKQGSSRRIGFVGFHSIGDATIARNYLNNSFINSNQSGSKIKAQFAKPIQQSINQSTNQPSTSASSPSHPPSTSHDDRLSEFLAVMNNNHQTNRPADQPQLTNPSNEVEERIDEFVSDVDYLAARIGSTDKVSPVEELTSDRLFIRNLTYSTSNHELSELFSQFGTVLSVDLPLDRQTNQPTGLGYVQFATHQQAKQAKDSLDGTPIKGRLLHILFATSRNQSNPDSSQTSLSLKQTKTGQLKQDQTGLNWATLYLNPDAVLDSVSTRLSIPKSVLLDHDSSGSAAVKLALAETNQINQTKDYFAAQGVNLDSFSFTSKRHPTTLLVKNLPFPTSHQTVVDLFTGFGELGPRVLIPPAGTLAIVDLLDKQAATKAYQQLAYKKLGKSLIYLEKAPINIWQPTNQPQPTPTQPAPATLTPASTSASPGATLFVKNLSFSTTKSSLESAFNSLNGFKFGNVQTKPDPNQPGQTLSMGFGFVGFNSLESAQAALAARQSFILDGHALVIQFAQRGKEVEDDQPSSSSSSKRAKGEVESNKLIVKNLAFEVTRNELRELFSQYGQLKSVRLPKKVSRQTRGFAFVEFSSSREAATAFNALKHSHLLGRHLVLQYANQHDNDLQQLRNKSHLSTSKPNNKKSKFVFDQPTQPSGQVEEAD